MQGNRRTAWGAASDGESVPGHHGSHAASTGA